MSSKDSRPTRAVIVAAVGISAVACATNQPPPQTQHRAGAPARTRTPTPPPERRAHPTQDRNKLYITGSPWTGVQHATVTIVVKGGFHDPDTKKTMEVMETVLKKYPREVKVVWTDIDRRRREPLTPMSLVGDEVYIQRGRHATWRFLRVVFAHHAELGKGKAKLHALIRKAVRAAGADQRRIDSLLSLLSRPYIATTGQRSRVTQLTRPTLLVGVNGILLRGHQRLRSLTSLIDAEVARAKSAIRRGQATRATYYDVIQRQATRWGSCCGKKGPRPKRYRHRVMKRKRRRLDPSAIYKVPVTGRSPWVGARRPLVTLVMYADVQCPYSKYAACVVRQLRKHYPRDLRVIYRANPLTFHRRALPAAEALMEAQAQQGNRGFWALYDRLFPMKYCRAPLPRIRPWLSGMPRYYPPLEHPWLRQAALDAGLDLKRLDAALRQGTHRKRVAAEQASAVRLGARGTPAFFVNGRYIRGIRTVAKFKQIIDEERRKARALLRRRRLTRRQLYPEIIKRGATAPVYRP